MKVQDISRSQCWTFLGKRRVGRLACALNNKPYVVPVSFAIQTPYLYAFTTDRPPLSGPVSMLV